MTDVVHRGSCHCGKVRFEFEAPAACEVVDCNCSICQRCGYLHLFIPKSKFKLLSGQSELVAYRFNTKVAEHLFCGNCGIKSFYQPRSHPDNYSINVRCIDDGTLAITAVRRFDGQHWEDSINRLLAKQAT